jgi:uncharacterized protein YqjF (DUF2071 family)
MAFLTARWSNLFLATYAVPEELLAPRLPPGLELDRREGCCFASLVAFDFLGTNVFGVPWPGFRNFPEVNLRFYVRQGDRRGVVFIREFVPKAIVAWVARMMYNEPYFATTMSSSVVELDDRVAVVHRVDYGGRTHTLHVTGVKPAFRPDNRSPEHFFQEQEWGFGMTKDKQTLVYRVEHPAWDVYRVADSEIDLDWATVYGPEWGILQNAQPYSVILAAGSRVTVHPATRLEAAQHANAGHT